MTYVIIAIVADFLTGPPRYRVYAKSTTTNEATELTVSIDDLLTETALITKAATLLSVSTANVTVRPEISATYWP
jgi:hypothetical protein